MEKFIFSDRKIVSSNQLENQENSLYTPSQIVQHLDRYVRGQQTAKKDVALALYSHLLYLSCRNNPNLLEEMGINFSFNPQHLLAIGATGCGKSYLIQKATEFVGLPCSFVSATSLVQTGYSGTSIDKMIESHYQRCHKDIKLTERSVIFIDEIDKIRGQNHSNGPDVSGEGVQNALLTLLDGKPVPVSENGHSDSGKKIDIDTSGILLICAGAFAAGLSDIIRSRLNRKQQNDNFPEAKILGLTQTEDLIEFGLIPEFIGRFSNIITLDALNVEDLVGIMIETKDSALQKHKTLFALHGIDLVFSPKALEVIAKEAMELQTGARGLNRILKKYLLDWEYQLPELAQEGISQIEINEYALLEGQASFKYSEPPQKAKITQFRQEAIKNLQTTVSTSSIDRNDFSDTTGWSETQIRAKIEEVKSKIGWQNTTGSARKWWDSFEVENQSKLTIILRLTEELLCRQATITEFFLAYVYSNTDNIQANLYYLDYTRLKKKESKAKKEEKAKQDSPKTEKSEPIEYIAEGSSCVILKEFPKSSKLSVLKVTRTWTRLGLKDVKNLIESTLPVILRQGLSQEKAEQFKQDLLKAGAKAEIMN